MSVSATVNDFRDRCDKFLEINGRRPRILLTLIEKKTSPKLLKSFAVVFADTGFDVDISPGFTSFEAIARMAVENDVHVVGVVGSSDNDDTRALNFDQARKRLDQENIKLYRVKEEIDEQMMNSHQNFESLIIGFASKILALIGA